MSSANAIMIAFLWLPVYTQASEHHDTAFTVNDFKALLAIVAEGWNEGNAGKAADCFAEDVIYIEPPNQQYYSSRKALYEMFGGSKGRAQPMTMTWHHIVFDNEQQIGFGEYTFTNGSKITHGIAIIKIAKEKIYRWREYQDRAQMSWESFVGDSNFKTQ